MTEKTPETIRYTADVVVVTDDGRVLLIQRGWPPFEGMWALPGGHVDVGETAFDAAVRELLEETGVRVAPEDMCQLGVRDEPGRDPRGRYVTIVHLAVVPDDTEIIAGDDARSACWWKIDGLDLLPLAFDHGDILADVLRGWRTS